MTDSDWRDQDETPDLIVERGDADTSTAADEDAGDDKGALGREIGEAS